MNQREKDELDRHITGNYGEDQYCFAEGQEEGERCNRDGCTGTIQLTEVEDCSCHINPPCQGCVEQHPYCPVCGFDPTDAEPFSDEKADDLAQAYFEETTLPAFEAAFPLLKGALSYLPEPPGYELFFVEEEPSTESLHGRGAWTRPSGVLNLHNLTREAFDVVLDAALWLRNLSSGEV